MATTPRPLVWQNIIEVSSSNNPALTAQGTDGNGKIFYLKNGTIYSKPVTVTQGHWQNMTLGNEQQLSSTRFKDYSTDHAVGNDVYSLGVCNPAVEGEPDRVYLIKDNLSTGTHNETLIHTIL